jgi:hypothetical protein
MVWGVTFPPTFGAHSPDGNFDAFKAQLHKNFDAMPEERRNLYVWPGPGHVLCPPEYVLEIYDKLTKNPSKRWHGHPASRPIEEHEWPAEFAIEKRRDNLAAIINIGDVLLVEDALKNIIERLEPGIHQFRPITITMPRGAVYPMQYYTMIIGQWLDSFAPEMSEPECFSGDGVRSSYTVKYPATKSKMAGLALSANLFGNSHLWRERNMFKPLIFMSNILHSEIIAAGLRLPKHFQMKEV